MLVFETAETATESTVGFDRRFEDVMTFPAKIVRATNRVNERLLAEDIRFGDSPLPTFAKPHLVSREDETRWVGAVTQFMAILERVGQILLETPELRAHLDLPPRSDELLHVDPGYSRLVAVSRLDMVWRNRDMRILEVNCDSPAMMTFTDRLEEIFLSLPELREFIGDEAQPKRRTKAMLEALCASYEEWGGTRADPTIAIVDWHGEATAGELLHTAADFEKFGCPTIVCDPRELRFINGELRARGRTIDIVQRRVLFLDFIRRKDELEPLINAYVRGRVCVVNPLRSYIVGNKLALALICQRLGDFDLSEAECDLVRALVPPTESVCSSSLERLRREKNDWVLKGAFGSGGKEVTLGSAVSLPDWRAALERAMRIPSIAQRRELIPRLRTPVVSPSGSVSYRDLYANWNPWFFSGAYAGASTRVSRNQVVSITAGGGLLPSIAV